PRICRACGFISITGARRPTTCWTSRCSSSSASCCPERSDRTAPLGCRSTPRRDRCIKRGREVIEVVAHSPGPFTLAVLEYFREDPIVSLGRTFPPTHALVRGVYLGVGRPETAVVELELI